MRLTISKDEIEEQIFKNKIVNYENMDWTCPIIAASITINDNEGIYSFKEYDITNFLIGFSRPNQQLNLNNSEENKQLWIFIFNYILKKNIHINPLNYIKI